MKIRRAHDDEIEEILELDRILFEGTHPPDNDWRVMWWVAVDEPAPNTEKIVGYAAAHLSSQYPNAIYLSRCGVIPEARGKGLQRRLIRARERWGRSVGAEWARTDTSCLNAPSINGLIKAGYKAFVPIWPWAGNGAVYFLKKIVAKRPAA